MLTCVFVKKTAIEGTGSQVLHVDEIQYCILHFSNKQQEKHLKEQQLALAPEEEGRANPERPLKAWV